MAVIDTRHQHDKYMERLEYKNRPSRPPIVVAGSTADNFVSAYFTGVPTLCDEVQP